LDSSKHHFQSSSWYINLPMEIVRLSNPPPGRGERSEVRGQCDGNRNVISFPLAALLCLLTTIAANAQHASIFLDESSGFMGLPATGDVQPVYHPDVNHKSNELFHLLFVQSHIASEIQSQLPSERASQGKSDSEFFRIGWYFQKRPGVASDKRYFGGDVRTSPRDAFKPDERSRLLTLLAEIARTPDAFLPEETKEFRVLQLSLQWDLMSVWWSFERAKSQDEELLRAMAQAIRALALPRQTLESLPSGMEGLKQDYAASSSEDTQQPWIPSDFRLTNDEISRWKEMDRKSSALFRANRSLRTSRVYVAGKDSEETMNVLARVIDRQEQAVEIPSGWTTVLVQQLIGIDEQLEPVATEVIDDFRVRVYSSPSMRDPMVTSSRDGSSHWVYQLSRFGLTRKDVPDFRFISDREQALFVEYGTKKHATFTAQCALCHRVSNDGGQSLAGIRHFSKHAQPRLASYQDRATLAVTEMSEVVEKLRSRLQSSEKVTTVEEKRKPRPTRTPEERASWVRSLREAYAKSSDQWPTPHVDRGVEWKELGTLPKIVHPDDNPYSKEKEMLGRQLFFDPRLSGSGQIACASCHDPDLGWADGRTTSFGHGRIPLKRNAPSIRNAGHRNVLFWDGRAASLEDQTLQVLNNPNEMRASRELIESFIQSNAAYQQQFVSVFGQDYATIESVAKAIACFERTVQGGSSRFESFMSGSRDVLKDEELIGLDLFRREARCMNCHHGPLMTDDKFHEVGLSYYGRAFEDLGRFEITKSDGDAGKFRTPSLRDLPSTAPYMHNGLFELEGVLNMYNAGMPSLKRKADQQSDPPFPIKSEHLKPLGLNREDLSDLQAFLMTLEESKRRIRPPDLP